LVELDQLDFKDLKDPSDFQVLEETLDLLVLLV